MHTQVFFFLNFLKNILHLIFIGGSTGFCIDQIMSPDSGYKTQSLKLAIEEADFSLIILAWPSPNRTILAQISLLSSLINFLPLHFLQNTLHLYVHVCTIRIFWQHYDFEFVIVYEWIWCYSSIFFSPFFHRFIDQILSILGTSSSFERLNLSNAIEEAEFSLIILAWPSPNRTNPSCKLACCQV